MRGRGDGEDGEARRRAAVNRGEEVGATESRRVRRGGRGRWPWSWAAPRSGPGAGRARKAVPPALSSPCGPQGDGELTAVHRRAVLRIVTDTDVRLWRRVHMDLVRYAGCVCRPSC
ncbi:putative leader peptide [Streptomyces sp. AK04-3B]|uniref:putative leader peptide n=1 Tax=unclassified Streptomyces TaxID=2593676 RepID=UPI0029C04234|nr:putative leader peptide [Streptomyces sp. AK04-3B]